VEGMTVYSFRGHDDLHEYIKWVRPDFIIDHYSIYLETNRDIYKKLQIPILYVMHTASCYAKDISPMNMKMCIHLYEEKENHPSWKLIPEQHIIPLGIPMDVKIEKKRRDGERWGCRIRIVGRISPEKIPLSFLQKLVALETQHEIIIYGEKHDEYNKSYIEAFEDCIANSSIQYGGFQPMESILAETDYLVIPSLYETGSYTCIEAFRHEIPVIARKGFGGISSLIQPHRNGYLCSSDEEIIDCIRDAHLLHIEEYTFDSNKYDIRNVIKQYETLIEHKIRKSRELFLITSVMHPSNEPLSYYPIRSVFNTHERWEQTRNTISSIRFHYPDALILLCEGSIYESESEKQIQEEVDIYVKLHRTEITTNPYKGYTECLLLLKAWETMQEYGYTAESFDSLFKISGRYALCSSFDKEQFHNTKNFFSYWENSTISYTTLFYKIHDIQDWVSSLEDSLTWTQQNMSLEMAMYETFQRNICIVDKLHVEGYLSTEGYLISV
jgi:hypothetical protein